MSGGFLAVFIGWNENSLRVITAVPVKRAQAHVTARQRICVPRTSVGALFKPDKL